MSTNDAGQESPSKPAKKAVRKPRDESRKAKARDTILGPMPGIPRRRHVLPESYKNHISPPWAVDEASEVSAWKPIVRVDKETATDMPFCRCHDNRSLESSLSSIHDPIPIERTLSWECLASRLERQERGDVASSIPDSVILPMDYFGKPQRRHWSTTKRNISDRPFYPPGAIQLMEDPERKSRIQSARKQYQSPIIRKRMGMPAFYKNRQRSLSEAQHDVLPFPTALSRMWSETDLTSYYDGVSIAYNLDSLRRDIKQERPREYESKTGFKRIDSLEASVIDIELESMILANANAENLGKGAVSFTGSPKPNAKTTGTQAGRGRLSNTTGNAVVSKQKLQKDAQLTLSKSTQESPSSSYACKSCGEFVEIRERMQLLQDYFHRMCFSCAVCAKDSTATKSETANSNGAPDDKKALRKDSEAIMAAKEVTKISQNVADAASVAGGTSARASDIRNRFEKGESQDGEKPVKQRKTKIKYAGVGSAKSKFMAEAQKVQTTEGSSTEPRKLKEITPPREGVVVGVLESIPKERPEGVEGASSGEYAVTDYIGIGKKTKDVRERFKQLEKTGGVAEGDDETKKPVDSEEFRQAATEATRSAKARWKDIESGKVETKVEKTKIDLGGSGQGGVSENEPDSLLGIARGGEQSDSAHLMITQSAAERKTAFLKNAAGEGNIKRIDPKTELQELASKEQNAIYESTPAARSDDIVLSAESNADDYKNLSGAKSIRNKFTDPSKFEREVKKTTIELRGEGGVYENQPEQRDDVVHGGDEADTHDHGDVKWASSAKERFMKDAEERAKTVKSQPVVMVDTSGGPSVFESQPASSAADAKADQEEDERLVGTFATKAKERFLQKQKEAEDSSLNKATPGIIDIWSEMPKESGVFENVPAARQEGIVVSGMYSDDDEEDEDEEEEE